MLITISFEYDTEHKVCRVLSYVPVPPFGLGGQMSVLHDSHMPDAAKKALSHAVKAALANNLPAITVPERSQP